jgi:hypothetical protein
MNEKKILLFIMIALLITPSIYAETLDVQLEVNGIESVQETVFYEGFEFQQTVFTDYSIIPLNLIKYHITKEHLPGFGEFTVRITDMIGQELAHSQFEPEIYLHSNAADTGRYIVELSLDYSEQSEYLEVHYKEDLKLKINIKEALCNQDSICNNYENYFSCSEDCQMYGEDDICLGYSGDNYCDLDCFTDSDCIKENCNDNIKNQDEIDIDKGGICDKTDCTLKELNNELTCGDKICSECEDIFSCPDDCLEEDLCEGPDCETIEKTTEEQSFWSFIKTGFAWLGIEFN